MMYASAVRCLISRVRFISYCRNPVTHKTAVVCGMLCMWSEIRSISPCRGCCLGLSRVSCYNARVGAMLLANTGLTIHRLVMRD